MGDIKDLSLKNFRRWVPFWDKVMYLGLPLLVTAVAIGAALTPQTWTTAAVLILGGVVVSSWAVGLGVLAKRIFAKPDIVIKNGPNVWTNDLPVTREMLLKAMKHFKVEANKRGFASPAQLDKMFDCLSVEYTKGKIRYTNKIKTGWAWGTQTVGTAFIRVMWRGGPQTDSFFHECAHVLRNFTLGLDPDYKHQDARIWNFVSDIKSSYK